VPRKNLNRASRMEWEHVLPASHLGSQRQCWQDGGRKNCSGHDPVFDAMEGDLNNLVPSVGEVNGDRGDMSYGAWTRYPEPVYGDSCKSIPDFKGDRFQPREEVRGRAARISLYMHTHYNLKISSQDKNSGVLGVRPILWMSGNAQGMSASSAGRGREMCLLQTPRPWIKFAIKHTRTLALSN